jgi:alcohol dehydrogenase
MLPMLFWSFGASAEYAAIPLSLLAPKPKNLSFIEAAALPLVGTTVVTGFDGVLEQLGGEGSLRNSKILVQAGSGGVGSFAVQYAKHGESLS